MTEFVRFPHTPHLVWLGAGKPRDDKVLTPTEAGDLLKRPVVVEEKLDGANLGISLGPKGVLRVQNRGQYLIPPYTGQFSRVVSWLAPRQSELSEALGDTLILFGEWCAARHSLDYERLPDWLLVFDVFDRAEERFWSTRRRDKLVTTLGLASVPRLLEGQTSVEKLKKLVGEQSSSYRKGPLEGVVVRQESSEWLESRAKVVRGNFTQSITEHWSRSELVWNKVSPESRG